MRQEQSFGVEDSFRAGLNEWKVYEHHCNQTTQVTVNNWILMSLGFRTQAGAVSKSRGGRPGLSVHNKTLWFVWNDITSYGGY